MARAFYRAGDLPLMSGAQTGFFALSNFSKTREKTPERDAISEVYVPNIFFAKITFHIKRGYSLRRFLHLLR